MPTRYIVTGTEPSSGAKVRREFEASSIAQAEGMAAKLGIDIVGIELAEKAEAPALDPADSVSAADSAKPGTEEVIWLDTPSQWPTLWRYLIIILALGVALYFKKDWWQYFLIAAALPTLWAMWHSLATATTRLILTTQRLRIQSGVFAKTVEEVELYRVRDSNLHQSLLQRLVGLGTVHLFTHDTTTPNLLLIHIRQPYEVREKVRKAVEKVRRVQRVRELDVS